MDQLVGSHESRLHFRIHYWLEDPRHDSLAILGSLPILGYWNPKKALLASRSEDNFWEADIAVPPGATFVWKWAVVEMDTGHVKRWEERGDRLFTANGQGDTLICAPWNMEPRVYTADDFIKPSHRGKGSYLDSVGILTHNFINAGRNALKSLTPTPSPSSQADHKQDSGKKPKVSFADEAADRICYPGQVADDDTVFTETPGVSHGQLEGHTDKFKSRRGILRHTSSTDAEPSSRTQEERIKDLTSDLGLDEVMLKKRRQSSENSEDETGNDFDRPICRHVCKSNGRGYIEHVCHSNDRGQDHVCHSRAHEKECPNHPRKASVRDRADSFLNNEIVSRYVLPSACVLSGMAMAYLLYTKLF